MRTQRMERGDIERKHGNKQGMSYLSTASTIASQPRKGSTLAYCSTRERISSQRASDSQPYELAYQLDLCTTASLANSRDRRSKTRAEPDRPAFVIAYSKADLDSFPWTRHQSKQEIESQTRKDEVFRKKEQGTPHSIKQEPELRAGQMKSTNRI